MGKYLRQEKIWLINEIKERSHYKLKKKKKKRKVREVTHRERGGAWKEMRVKYKGLIQLGSVARAECVHHIEIAMEHRNGEQCKPCKGRGQEEGTR